MYPNPSGSKTRDDPQVRLLNQEKEPPRNGQISIFINVKNLDLKTPTTVQDEQYGLEIKNEKEWWISAQAYPGFVHALETLSQLVERNESKFVINNTPISISDIPEFPYRGIMIDSSRHFLKVANIKKTIDALMFNKMNVLHWHIVDEDSFPLEITSIPELMEYGSFDKKKEVYTQETIKSLVNYAKVRGVRLIPEIDTPAHTYSWGFSPKLKNITLNCSQTYNGQFDPTMNETYDTITKVFNETKDLFPDDMIHFGGDEVDEGCWDQRPAIKEFMAKENISTYKDLQIYYRNKSKKIFRETLKSNKSIIYWANQDLNLPVQEDDIIQWWGNHSLLDAIKDMKNQVILSSWNLLYLDVGVGTTFGSHYWKTATWKQIYEFNPKLPDGFKGTSIGAEAPLWSELSTDHTHFTKLWPRASCLGERLWNTGAAQPLSDVIGRLVAFNNKIKLRGIPVSPFVTQQCELHPYYCVKNTTSSL